MRFLVYAFVIFIAACGNEIKVHPIDGGTKDFVTTADNTAATVGQENFLMSDLPPALLVSPDDLIRFINPIPASTAQPKLGLALKTLNGADFLLDDAELNHADRSYLGNSSDLRNGFIAIQRPKETWAFIRPLVVGVLYQMEIVKNGARIPAVILRRSLESQGIQDDPGNLPSTDPVKNIADALKEKQLEAKVVRIYGLKDLVQISEATKEAFVSKKVPEQKQALMLGQETESTVNSAVKTVRFEMKGDLAGDNVIAVERPDAPILETLLMGTSFVVDFSVGPVTHPIRFQPPTTASSSPAADAFMRKTLPSVDVDKSEAQISNAVLKSIKKQN